MPQFDGTGPRGEGMFTGRGQGYCTLRLPEPGSGEPAVGYAGMQGRPVQFLTDFERQLADADVQTRMLDRLLGQGRRCRFGRRRCESQRLAAH